LFIRGRARHWSSPLAIWMRRSGGDIGKSRKGKIDPLPEHFDSLEEAAEFWDTHSTADYEEHMKEAHFDVGLKWVVEELRVAYDVVREVRRIARQQGLSTEAPINLWLQEKICEQQRLSERKHKQAARKHAAARKPARSRNGAARSAKA